MAVDVKQPSMPKVPDMRAYLRSAAQQELQNLKSVANSQLPSNTLPGQPLPGSYAETNSNLSPIEGNYRISQNYGNYNPELYGGRTAGARHPGLDIATPSGTLVKSPFTGVVKAGKSKDFGNFIEVRTADGQLMRFSHLSSVDDLAQRLGQAGREIQAGQPLGMTGNTGYSTAPHLDIMYQKGGQWTNPLNYEPLKRSLG